MEKKMTTEEKLDYLIKKVEALDQKINPPLWKSALWWVVHNFWILLLLGGILYAVWEIWAMVQYTQGLIETLELKIDSAKTGVHNSVEKLKFWK